MKKLFVTSLAIAIVFMLSFTVCAAPGSFIESPSGNKAPVLEDYSNEDPNCTASLVIIPYKDRATLTEEEVNEMETVYDDISSTDDLSDVDDIFGKLSRDHGIDPVNLAISDLFHINYSDCVVHDDHGAFRIKLSADTLKGFVGLAQYINGGWTLVDNAVVEDNEYLVFTAEELSTFAIVVDVTKGATTSPQTGDPTADILAYTGAVSFMVIAFAAVVTLRKKKA